MPPWPTSSSRPLVVLAVAILGSLVGCGGITTGAKSSRIGLLALRSPAGRIVVLKTQVEGNDCPGGTAYGDYAAAIRNAIASVSGANILTNVTLSSAESPGVAGVGICVRATGDAGRLE